MSIQLLVEGNKRNVHQRQVLPTVFTNTLFTGSKRLYLIHNGGIKHKVYIRKVAGSNNYELYSHEWARFLEDSGYRNVSIFHFIRQAEDEYYVTAYWPSGIECKGYELGDEEDRLKRFFVTLENIEQSPVLPFDFIHKHTTEPIEVHVADRLVSTVTHNEVAISNNQKGRVLSGEGWHILSHVENLQVGSRLVLTNRLENTISLVVFGDDGMGLQIEMVPPMPLNSRVPFINRSDDKDLRMPHYCTWEEHHTYHEDENRCFYAPILAYVTAKGRLTIPHGDVKALKLRKYHNFMLHYQNLEFYVEVDLEFHSDRPWRRHHMNIKANWKHIVRECDFEDNKMVRFKLVGKVKDVLKSVDGAKRVMIPVFHMC